MKKSYEIDMCNGPLLGKILVFSIPLMLSGILQLLFNAADIIVVGRFAGSTALAPAFQKNRYADTVPPDPVHHPVFP